MNNIFELDNIIEDLKKKVKTPILEQQEGKNLSQEQLAIKSFLEERGIHYLVHFTDEKNISSIRKNGLFSVEKLKDSKIAVKPNDGNRYDNAPDFISLSVSRKNKYVYNSFRYTNQTIEHGVAVVISADILYKEIDTTRVYCVTNAATSDARKGFELDDFRAMFSDVVEYKTQTGGERRINRQEEQRNLDETTDIQAEILWKNCVPVKYILCYWDLEEDFFYGN